MRMDGMLGSEELLLRFVLIVTPSASTLSMRRRGGASPEVS
jgi:hypothetical protein